MEFKYKPRELKLFWYWINERHSIYLKRKAGVEYPWTKDKVLGEYKFTNPYRQLDRVTQEWTNRWVGLLHRGAKMTDGDILFHLCMFRFFNWPETYDALYFNMSRWNMKKAIEILRKRRDEDFEQIFTGAYIVTGGGKNQPKHETICEALQFLWDNRVRFSKAIREGNSMQKAVEILQEIPTVGLFVAYEIACDLRHTRILADARDILSWANPGPGAKRGIHRLLTTEHAWDKDYKWPRVTGRKRGAKPDYVAIMRDLLKKAPASLNKDVFKCEWPFEMREIEHSLCEFDKMRRVMKGEGKPRSRYHYKPPREVYDDEE